MRKITFNEDTIEKIRNYANNGISLMGACNRFTITPDVMKRVAKENGIVFIQKRGNKPSDISDETANLIKNLYENTNTDLHSIREQAGIRYQRLQDFLSANYSEEYQNARKSRLYSLSKMGTKNPMTGKTTFEHPRYKGIVSDGNGYLMCLKPEWYTGRVDSKYVFLHSVVLCEHLGLTEIPKGYVVHHIDGDKCNNNIDNLALMTISAHGKLHALQRNLCKVQRSEKIRREKSRNA